MINLDPIIMFRLMRDIFANSYGAQIFHHRGPTPTSNLARPKMDAYVHDMGLRSEAGLFHNPIMDGVGASLVKNAVMIGAGTSDTLGPLPRAILEVPQNPRPLIRITKDFVGDLANGLWSIGAQLSFYSKYGTPGDTTYAKTVVWTDLGIAAASYLGIARALAKPRMPTPQLDPPPLFVHGPELAFAGSARAYTPSVGLSMELPKLPPMTVMATMVATQDPAANGPKKSDAIAKRTPGKLPESNEVFLKLFVECGRNVARLAERLDVTRAAIYNRIKAMAEDIPMSLHQPRKVRTISYVRQPLTDDLLVEQYVAHGYNWTTVADRLGVKTQSIYSRIKRALKRPEPSNLKMVIEVQRALVPITDAHVRAALIAYRFDLKRAAGFLGMTVEELKATGMPLTAEEVATRGWGVEHRVVTPLRAARPATLTPDRIALLYIQLGRDLDAVASAAKISRTALDEAILNELKIPNTTLRLLYEVTTGMVPISDAHIACVMMLHDLDLARAAAFLRMTPETIIARAKAANPGSSLHIMQGLRP